jgi:hypothetical protein
MTSRLAGLILTAVMGLPMIAGAQTLRMQSGQVTPARAEKSKSDWSGFLRYGIGSDYASDKKPRAYNNSITGSLGYQFDANWSLSAEAGAKGQFVDGEIEKTENQTASEKLSPSTSVELGREGKFFEYHKVSLFVHGEPLWDEISRREGYRGIFGGGGGVTFNLFDSRYKMSHTVDYSEMNQIYYSSADGEPNPANFITYGFSNSLKLFMGISIGYRFGVKFTRYVDDNTDYSFNNSVSLSKAWGQFTTGLGYENGGFTQDGDVSLWYLDQYRRIFKFSMGYTF